MQGGVHGWESMGRLLRPGTCAKITHIELRIEHRAPRLLPARCDADAWPCLDFQALGCCVVTMICSPTVLACIDPMHFSALYKKEPGRVGTLWAGKPAGFGWFSVGRSWPLGTSLGTSLGPRV